MQTDRNLLFGVLAFQDEYIDLAQLAAICRAWAADKSRSMPQLLVERQWLSPQEREELDRKIERKLKRFVGDAHATLGAVADGAVRDVLKQVNDPDISESLSSWPDSGHVLMETLVPDALAADKTSSRYTLTHVHGKGGIGQVWLAYDKQLNREVALKELRPERSRNSDVWRRFLREAQITGQLQHPNIVPVYDLDRRVKDQQPFYTMKLVQGRTMRDAIAVYHEQRGAGCAGMLELNQLLQSFVSVCHAVAYAHSRGVVHRDLKPHNIVLGDFGEVIVLDWGEAKLVGEPEAATETLTQSDPAQDVVDVVSIKADSNSVAHLQNPSIAREPLSSFPVSVTKEAEPEHHTIAGQPTPGTPAYMSPEQAAGRLDQIEPRTDVYGLGAILFDIVTGQPPHRLESGETVKDLFPRIVMRPTPRVRERVATIPMALDAICAKAMAGSLESRYISATELAQDVQCFLADEPVSACQDPVLIRARRWMKHHQVIVATTAAAVMVAVIGLGTLAAVTSQHNTRLALVNAELSKANQREREQTELATKRATELDKANQQVQAEAENAKQSAEDANAVRNFFEEKVLSAARPKSQEGGLGVDATIRAAVDAAEPQIRANFHEQPLVEASIRSALGSTYLYLGESALAIEQFERCRELRLKHLGPDSSDTLVSMSRLALAYRDAGQFEESLLLIEEALVKYKSTLGPDHPETLRDMINVGLVYQSAGRVAEAIAILEQAVEKMTATVGADHSDTITSTVNLAMAYQAGGQIDKALLLLEQTLEQMKATRGIDHPDTLKTTNNLAMAYGTVGDLKKAIPLYEKVLEQRKALLGPDHPDTLQSMNNLGSAYYSDRQIERAVPVLEETFEKRKQKLGLDHPSTLNSMNGLATAYESSGEPERALTLIENAFRILKVNLGPDHPQTLSSMNTLAAVYQRAGKLDQALPLYEQTLEERKKKLGLDHPDTLMSMNNLAFAYAAAGKFDQALQLYEQTLEEKKKKLGPEHPDTVSGMSNLGTAYFSARQFDRAVPLLEETLEKRKAKFGPDHPDTLLSMENLGFAYEAIGKLDNALPLFEQTVQGRKKTLGPDHPITLTSVIILAERYAKLELREKAEPLLREIVTFVRAKFGADSPQHAARLSVLIVNLFEQKKMADAEPFLREWLAFREKTEPDVWSTFNTKSMLGGSLLAQKKYAEAEPLLLSGYEGMKERETIIPPVGKSRLTDAIQRLVDLYDAKVEKDKADEWRKKLPASKP